MLRLFDSLETEPNTLFQDSFRSSGRGHERSGADAAAAVPQPIPLGAGNGALRGGGLCAYRRNETGEDAGKKSKRMIPLYRTPAAAGYAAPVFGEDFDYIPVTEEVPQAAEFALRISGDSMMPYIADGSRGLREPGAAADRGCGDLLRGRRHVLQAV